jgi:hypothetical protein
MRSSAGPRDPNQISESLQHQLSLYALAASAAGVGMLALSPTAQAKIVYTPTHVVLPFGVTNVDFNHDGITDLAFSKSHEHLTSFYGTNLGVFYIPLTPWVVDRPGENGVGDLRPGFVIGGNDTFSSKGDRMAAGFFLSDKATYIGEWAHHGKGVKNRYVGVKFMIKGKVHYGWARLSVSFPNHSLRAVLTGYAYETIPNKAIVAGQTEDESQTRAASPAKTRTPQPASLGALAMGSRGLSIWKRDETHLASE